MEHKQEDYIISKEEIERKRRQINKEKYENFLDDNLKRMAFEKFDEARFSEDRKKAFEKAMDAYEIYPIEYQFKTFAISKMESSLERELEYKKLIKEVEKELDKSDDELYKFYDWDEINSYRFKDLKYKYVISLIQNEKYEEALVQLKSFNEKYSYLDFKTKHLVLNLCILLDKKDIFISEYNSISGNENILYKLPLVYVLFKNGKYNDSRQELLRLQELNSHIYDILINLDLETMKKQIFYSKSRFKIASNEEALFSLKYFINIYNRKDFQKFIEGNKR